ncbi:PhzF family phenazine biosynthesis protein [Gloeobacter kilaueensis]|uniref:Phenazine biosynthesis protein PhzF family n=1 Tax=Gloeobacter kilaueensis (strain ATCC BAA-2537 / CCAP 1431/1 / ULC 316 / JS1) TaxID=1183438 RepID=U5QEC5_GLOK1|nr:PhzF family phenazine biosynthesis protein [Gloeobacter kilaueensis]AGY57276.1 phenazine biosynthesis protein PhzF family [Gloeobacter kilaueensis JS1]
MPYRYYTADVFTDQIFGGNPLAVFPDARAIDPEQMQHIAREFNLSETVFVLPPEQGGTRRLRIFTPQVELPFAGHPTVGTAFVLAAIGDISLTGERTEIVFEEGVGPVPVTVEARNSQPVSCTLSAAQMPEYGPEPPAAADLAAVLSLETRAIAAPARAISCGVPFLFVPITNLDALGRIRLELTQWQRVLGGAWASMIFAFVVGADPERADYLRARMFAPSVGVLEDPATGSAVTALAGYLALEDPLVHGTCSYLVEQGVEMGRPSFLNLQYDLQDGQLTAIRVGGRVVLVSKGEFGPGTRP